MAQDRMVVGLDELLDALDETALNLTEKRKAIASALRKGGKVIQKRAEQTAPVKKGQLRVRLGVAVKDQTASGAHARIGVRDIGFYGKFAEYGTAHQPKTPWLGPAFEQSQEEAVEVVGETLGDEIEDAFLSGH